MHVQTVQRNRPWSAHVGLKQQVWLILQVTERGAGKQTVVVLIKTSGIIIRAEHWTAPAQFKPCSLVCRYVNPTPSPPPPPPSPRQNGDRKLTQKKKFPT